MTEPRDPAKLCGRPLDIREAGETERDLVYCGLHVFHSGAHMAIVWWFDEAPDAATAPPPSAGRMGA